MEQFLTHFGYWGIFMVLVASGAGLPMPEDIPLIFGGYLCSQDLASLHIMIPFTFFTVIGSDTLLYLIGRRYGRHVPNLPVFRRFLTPQRLAAAELAFHTHGGKTLFTSRFVPGVRAAVFFTAGVFKVPTWKFLLFDGAAALISVPLLVLLGYYFSNNIAKVRDATFATQALIGLIVLGIIALVFWRRWRKRKATQAANLESTSVAMTPAPLTPPVKDATKPSLKHTIKPSPSKIQP